jgi:hypothetical protein
VLLLVPEGLHAHDDRQVVQDLQAAASFYALMFGCTEFDVLLPKADILITTVQLYV